MSLKPLADCKKTLAFQTNKKWPQALPPLAWRGELLCGFNATSAKAWEMDENSSTAQVVEAFLDIHSDFSFMELVGLRKNVQNLSWGEEFFRELLRQNAKGQEQQWLKLLKNLSLINSDLIQQWQQKHLQFGDLRPLLSLDEKLLKSEHWQLISHEPFSKSEWNQVIEWFSELLMMKKDHELHLALEPLQHKPRELLSKLKELRYPETFMRDRIEQDFWKKLPWPKNTQAEFRRHGDQTKAYVSMHLSSLNDLKKIAQELDKMADRQESEH